MSWEARSRHYWTQRGLTYEAHFLETEARRLQEDAIVGMLRGLEFESVLDVGCGFGRIGALIRPTDYTGIDLSPAMLLSASSKIPNGTFRKISLDRYEPGRQFDLVLAVEVLMHQPQAAPAIQKLRSLSSGHVLTVDWTKPLPGQKQDSHNWIHDYRKLYGDALIREVHTGYQSVYLVRGSIRT